MNAKPWSYGVVMPTEPFVSGTAHTDSRRSTSTNASDASVKNGPRRRSSGIASTIEAAAAVTMAARMPTHGLTPRFT
jgi:hypothetical protein